MHAALAKWHRVPLLQAPHLLQLDAALPAHHDRPHRLSAPGLRDSGPHCPVRRKEKLFIHQLFLQKQAEVGKKVKHSRKTGEEGLTSLDHSRDRVPPEDCARAPAMDPAGSEEGFSRPMALCTRPHLQLSLSAQGRVVRPPAPHCTPTPGTSAPTPGLCAPVLRIHPACVLPVPLLLDHFS